LWPLKWSWRLGKCGEAFGRLRGGQRLYPILVCEIPSRQQTPSKIREAWNQTRAPRLVVERVRRHLLATARYANTIFDAFTRFIRHQSR
jgi:hypothetical protein